MPARGWWVAWCRPLRSGAACAARLQKQGKKAGVRWAAALLRRRRGGVAGTDRIGRAARTVGRSCVSRSRLVLTGRRSVVYVDAHPVADCQGAGGGHGQAALVHIHRGRDASHKVGPCAQCCQRGRGDPCGCEHRGGQATLARRQLQGTRSRRQRCLTRGRHAAAPEVNERAAKRPGRHHGACSEGRAGRGGPSAAHQGASAAQHAALARP